MMLSSKYITALCPPHPLSPFNPLSGLPLYDLYPTRHRFTSVRRGALLHNKIQMSYMYMMLWYDEFIM